MYYTTLHCPHTPLVTQTQNILNHLTPKPSRSRSRVVEAMKFLSLSTPTATTYLSPSAFLPRHPNGSSLSPPPPSLPLSLSTFLWHGFLVWLAGFQNLGSSGSFKLSNKEVYFFFMLFQLSHLNLLHFPLSLKCTAAIIYMYIKFEACCHLCFQIFKKWGCVFF